MKIAIVVQRFGDHFAGGAEYLARIYAQHLVRKHEVTIVTSCAKDYRTWANDYPEGESTWNHVKVERFAVDQERDYSAFSQFSYAKEINAFNLNELDEETYFREQGPLVPSMVDYLEDSYDQFDIFIFFTYLYYPTVMGLPKVADKSYLVATVHDEPPFYFIRTYAPLFHSIRGIIFLSDQERRLITSIYKLPDHIKTIHGKFELPAQAPLSDQERQEFDTKFQDFVNEDYFLYLGRASSTKSCFEMIHAFDQARDLTKKEARLVFCGSLDIKLPERYDISYLGYISEREKIYLLERSLALINPSRHESLSLVILESWNVGTPVVVNGASKVMKELTQKAKGGLYYQSESVFIGLFIWCLNYPKELKKLGQQGQQFVKANYTWDIAEHETFSYLR